MLTYSLEPTKNYPTDSLNNLASASASAFSSVITKIENSHSLPSTTIIQPEKSKKNWGLIRFINRITKNEQISNQEYSYLLCSTVHPKTARKFEGKIKFNGTGDIISLRKKSITREDYNILIKNRIKPLNETPQIMENRIRTPGEAIIDIAGLIKKTSETLINKKELEKLIKCTWLDGSLSQQSLHNMVELVKIKLSEHPNIISDIDHIMETLEKDFFVTKRNDNYYGRLFETELSKYIVNNPCDNMIKVRDIVGGFILDDFLNISEVEQINLCHVLAESMYKDPPLWRYNISHADVFLLERTPKNFIEMMRFKGSHSVSLVLSTAVKYITFSPGTRTLKNRASQYYVNKILPQRTLIGSFDKNKMSFTTHYGLLLSYQKSHPPINKEHVGFGIRPIDKYMRPSAGIALTEHDAAALANERPIGIGISGSSNILHFLFRELQSQDKDFPLDDAKLATASWLSYSGGHSFNEAYSVFGFMTEGNFKPLSFNVLKTSSALSEVAIAHAYNKVIEASIALSS